MHQHVLPRKQAEALSPVNHTGIYDAFPVPASVDQLRVVTIPDWTTNACIGPHSTTTAVAEALVVTKTRSRMCGAIVRLVDG